jgi:hypothetical protein
VKSSKATSGFLSLVLMAGLLVSSSAPANATLRVPKTPFKACSEVGDASLYCIESVSVTNSDGRKVQLVYVPAGQDVPATVAPENQFMPVAVVKNTAVSYVTWMNKWEFDSWYALPGKKAIDVSSLVGTANHPDWGATFDPATDKWDITLSIDYWAQPAKCYLNGVYTDATMKDCRKSSVVYTVDNKIISQSWSTDINYASREVAESNSRKYVDVTTLATSKLQPSVNSIYNATANTFSKTEPLSIPSWVKIEAFKQGWKLPGEDVAPAPVTGTSSETPGAVDIQIDTQTVVPAQVEAGRVLPGRWTSAEWSKYGLNSLGYDVIFLEAKAANEFVNHLFVDGLPTITGADKKVNLASAIGSKGYAANLDPDITISVTVRSGDIRTGVIMASAIDVVTDTRYFGGYSTITITGSPVTVPLAKSVKDCIGEEGVAKANVRQFQATVIVQNDTSGFGVEGTSGDMYVGTNGVCEGSTPVWNEQTKEFTWTAAAPHFASDGKTVNKGFYKAVIPVADAKLLWGMTNPNDAATALKVSVTTETGGSTAAISVIAVKGGKIIIDVSNFEYSRPKLTIALKKGYKPTSSTKRTTITCVMGKSTKKITAVKPTCPKGYLKKK